MKKQGFKDTLLVALVTLIGLALLWVRTDRMTYSHPHFANSWDHHKYIYMAKTALFNFHIAPFGWRILTPFLARILPFEIHVNFSIIAFVSLWGTAILMYSVLKEMRFEPVLSFVGSLLFIALGWATRYNMYDFWLPDPLGFLFLTAALLSLLQKKTFLFSLLLAIGVLAKESVLFVAPLYYTFNTKRWLDFRLFIRSLFVIAPALITLFLVRIAIPPLNGNAEYLATIPQNCGDPYPYNVVFLFKKIGLPRLQNLSGRLWEFTGGTFGTSILFLSLFGMRKSLSFLIRAFPLVFFAYFSILFATNTSRLIVWAFPAVIPLALYDMKNIAEIANVQTKMFLPFPFLLLLFFLKKEKLVLPSALEAFLLLSYLAFVLQANDIPWLANRSTRQ